MNDAGTQHPHDLTYQCRVVGQRVFLAEGEIVEARRGFAVGVGHQLHQQHAFVEVVGRGHAHPGRGQAVQGVDLGALPRGFLFLTAIA